MAKIDKEYNDLLSTILRDGFKYEDPNRKGVQRIQIPNYTFKHNFKDGFPAITTKKLYWKGVVGELLWFLRGSKDIRELWKANIHIWDKDWLNYTEWFIKDGYGTKEDLLSGKCEDYMYELGPIYGYQWRNFTGKVDVKFKDSRVIHNSERVYDTTIYNYVDQISNLIKGLKENPMGTKHMVTAWNPAELDGMALPPCHWSFEILVEPIGYDLVFLRTESIKKYGNLEKHVTAYRKTKEEKNLKSVEALIYNLNLPKYQFTLKWHQRSVDTFLGLPFNIASYALLAQIIGKMTNMIPKGIIGDLSNVHIYEPHLDAVKEQLSRDVNKYDKCELDIRYTDDTPFTENHDNLNVLFDALAMNDFELKGYKSYPTIPAEMLAYNK